MTQCSPAQHDHTTLHAPKTVRATPHHPLKVLTVVRESKKPDQLTAASFLNEELPALARQGIEYHTVWHDVPFGWAFHDQLRVHRLPALRDLQHSIRAARYCMSPVCDPSLHSKTFRARLQLARHQLAIADVVQRENIDLIHSHWIRPAGTGALLAKKLTGVPVVFTLRGADVLVEPEINYGQTLDPYTCARIQHALANADRVMCISHAIRNRAIELGSAPEHTIVVHKGVDTQAFQPGDRCEARRQVDLDDRPTILFVGSLIPAKGLRDLLDAFVIVRKRGNDTQLVLCGTGWMDREIREFAERHELQNDIVLTGYINRTTLPQYFHACDVFVLPSLTEGAGNVILEASACGRPCVGTRVGGIPDYIFDGETGFLANKQDPDDLADKLTAILADESLASRMGTEARRRVETEFRYDQMIDRTLAVYHEVLS